MRTHPNSSDWIRDGPAEVAMTAAEGQVKLESVNKQLEGKVFFANCCERNGLSLTSGRKLLPLAHPRRSCSFTHV